MNGSTKRLYVVEYTAPVRVREIHYAGSLEMAVMLSQLRAASSLRSRSVHWPDGREHTHVSAKEFEELCCGHPLSLHYVGGCSGGGLVTDEDGAVSNGCRCTRGIAEPL